MNPSEVFADILSEALPKFWSASCVDSLLTIGDRKLAAKFERSVGRM